MAEFVLPVLFALFVWWASTGLIILLDGLPRASYRWSMGGATAILALSFYGAWAVADDASLTGAYLGFLCGIGIWAWHEMSFLFGLVTGPRREPCPEEARGLRRFIYAASTLIHHELAIAVTGLALLAMTVSAENAMALWTFLLLWAMRISAKLNLFLGVPRITIEFLPAHLDYLKSYFRRGPMNSLFPVSVLVAVLVAAGLISHASAADTSAFQMTAALLLASLMSLAILEHGFMVLPIPDAALWRFCLPEARQAELDRELGRLNGEVLATLSATVAAPQSETTQKTLVKSAHKAKAKAQAGAID